MDISNICTDKLKLILIERKQKLEELYRSDDYNWVVENKVIEEEYYKILNRYKHYFYKKKLMSMNINGLHNEISKIENELDLRNMSIDKIVLKKRFDNESIL